MLSLFFLLLTAATTPPFATVEQASALVCEHAVVLDARDQRDFAAGHLPGAVRIDWKDYRDGWGRTGRLSDDDRALARSLGKLGVDEGRAVLVYGRATAGFGEEGRIAWMLSYLGHPRVSVLDGGYAAWRAAGRAVEVTKGSAPPIGTFTPHRDDRWRATLPDVVAASQGGGTVLDTRTALEWNGATPYWEARGGHIPGAHHLSWTALFDGEGRLRPRAELERLVAAAGVTHERPVLLYCTGGVRSALVWVVLRSLGYDAKNFDASFWEWARHDELPVVH